MNIETKKFHEPNGGLNFHVIVHPNNGVSGGHDHFPDDIPGEFGGLEEAIFGYITSVVSLFPFEELRNFHPEIIYIPTLEDASKVLSEYDSSKSTLCINNIDPHTFLSVGHDFEGFPKEHIFSDLDIFDFSRLLQQWENINCTVELDRGIICHPQNVQENILEVEYSNYHMRFRVLNQNTMNFLHTHC